MQPDRNNPAGDIVDCRRASFPSRELFRANLGNFSSSGFSSGELMILRRSEKAINDEAQRKGENGDTKVDVEDDDVKTPSDHSSLVGLDDESDKFFDVAEDVEDDQSANGCPCDFGPEMYPQDKGHAKLSTPPGFVKKLHEFAVQKRVYTDLEEMVREDIVSCNYTSTLPNDPTSNLPSSWTSADPSLFQIRGQTFLEDHKKITGKGTLMQTVAVDWLRSDKREDNLGGRPGNIVQKFAANGSPEFFLIVNMQIPGSTTYSLAFYFMMSTPVEDRSLLQSFIRGDDAYRNSRFKFIPYVSKGPWIVKQSVRNRACLLGKILKINYVRGKNYLELDVDVGSSTLARGVTGLVLSYFHNVIIELAILIQANTPEELPECLLGTCSVNRLDLSKSVLAKP